MTGTTNLKHSLAPGESRRNERTTQPSNEPIRAIPADWTITAAVTRRQQGGRQESARPTHGRFQFRCEEKDRHADEEIGYAGHNTEETNTKRAGDEADSTQESSPDRASALTADHQVADRVLWVQLTVTQTKARMTGNPGGSTFSGTELSE